MARKRITQIFPFLLPLRVKQRKLFFYLKMRFDRNRYSKIIQNERLPYEVFYASFSMINEESGHDIQYQYNKVHNLKLAAATMNGLLIKPSETFSFWMRARFADKKIPYKDGLTLVYGKVIGQYGGGLCQLSDLIYWMFLHTPLEIVERHPHTIRSFPASGIPQGAEATISEGWLDLKAKNRTSRLYQLVFEFTEDSINGFILSDSPAECRFEVEARDVVYIRRKDSMFEQANVYRKYLDAETGTVVSEDFLYTDRCEIGFNPPEGAEIVESDD